MERSTVRPKGQPHVMKENRHLETETLTGKEAVPSPMPIQDVFLQFVCLRIHTLEMLDLMGGRMAYLVTKVNDQFDDALTQFYAALSDEQRKDAASFLLHLGIADRKGQAQPWATELLMLMEDLDPCARRQEIRKVQDWLLDLMRKLHARTLGTLAQKLGVERDTLENYWDWGYVRPQSVGPTLKKINVALAHAEEPEIDRLLLVPERWQHRMERSRSRKNRKA